MMIMIRPQCYKTLLVRNRPYQCVCFFLDWKYKYTMIHCVHCAIPGGTTLDLDVLITASVLCRCTCTAETPSHSRLLSDGAQPCASIFQQSRMLILNTLMHNGWLVSVVPYLKIIPNWAGVTDTRGCYNPVY